MSLMGLFSFAGSKERGSPESVALQDAPAVRAKSAFFSPATLVRPLKAELGLGESDVAGALVGRAAAQSFTAGSRRRAASPLAAPAPAKGSSSPASIKYTSLNSDFSQVVELYRGSISTVYRATCVASQWPVIIKAYQKHLMKEKHVLRLEREIRIMRLLAGDASAVQLYNVFEDSNCRYLVMESCTGGDLFKAMLLRGGRVEEQWVFVKMVAPLLHSLVRLHGLRILHRDIKPENIFLTAAQDFKLGDFGLAIQADLELPFTRSGTLDYLSPEVLANPTCDLQESTKVSRAQLRQRGVRPYNEKVDCWAAGVLAYELVVGRPPFEVKNESKTAAAIMYKNDFPLPAKYSQQWADFVVLALQKNPAQRPSAVQLLEHPWIRMHTSPAPIPLAVPGPDLMDTSASTRDSRAMSVSLGHEAKEALASSDSMDRTASTAPMERTGSTVAMESSSSSCDTPMHAVTRSPTTVLPRSADLLQPFPSSPRSPQPSRLKNSRDKQQHLQPERAGGSFTTLLANVAVAEPSYIDSGNILEGEERKAGGMRLRMKHYFKRQA